jgi:hypothetical protein
MSILLSAYFSEGIVFAADKNATIQYGQRKFVQPTATKVLSWPYQKAVVGFVGRGQLAGLQFDEWMRVFIAGTRDFDNIDELAYVLRDHIQRDFDRDLSQREDVSEDHLVIHLGGFTIKEHLPVPVMYHIWNHGDLLPPGEYPPAERLFRLSEDIERDLQTSSLYPAQVRDLIQQITSEREFLWYNNGYNFKAFNVFKAALWQSLQVGKEQGWLPDLPSLSQRTAFCKMAIQLFGSFFEENYVPEDRAVGGGLDVTAIPWPE